MTRVSHYILFVHWTQTIADPLDSNIFYTVVCMSVRVGGSVYLYTHTFKKEEWEEVKERGWFKAVSLAFRWARAPGCYIRAPRPFSPKEGPSPLSGEPFPIKRSEERTRKKL